MVLLTSAKGEVSFLTYTLEGTIPEKVVDEKTILSHGVQIIAASDNTDPIKVGLSDVSDNYITIAAGKSLLVPIDDLHKLYFLGTAGDILELMLV